MASLYQIDKLDESNYAIWSIQMRSILVHSELWGVVCGRELKPEDSTSPSFVLYEARNEKALASILLCVKPNQVNHIKSCVSASDAWRRLREIHQPKGPARKIMLFKKLLYLSMQEGGNMSVHINDFSSLIDQLSEIEVIVPEEMLVILLLSSLPKSYEGFVIAMESRDSLPNLASLKIKLLEEGARQQDVTANNYSNNNCAEVLNVARSSGNYNNSQPHKNKKQHYDNNNNKNSGNDKKCYNCGRRGHFAAKCGLKHKHQKDEKRNEFNCFVSLATLKTSNNNNIQWCVDSGASSHFCFDYDLFQKYEKCNEDVYLPNNNSLKAVGRGNVVINDNKKRIILRNVLHVPELKEIEKPASAFSKHSQMKKQNPKKVTKQQATQSKKAGTENTKDQTTNAATTSETVRKPRKQLTPLQADRRFWKEVKDLQNCTSFLIPMLPFARLVRELVYQASTEVTKITPTAMEALQASSELYMTQRMQDAYMLTLHRGRVTLDVKDMQLLKYLKLNVQ